MEQTGTTSYKIDAISKSIEFELSNNREAEILKTRFSVFLELFEKHKVVLAGGAITSIFTSQKVNDYDFFFESEETQKAFTGEFQSLCTNLHLSTISKQTSNALNVTVHLPGYTQPFKFQFISLRYGNAQQIIDSFDFTICQGAYDFRTQSFLFNPTFFKDIAQKKIIFNSLHAFPFTALIRMNKYVKRGYSIDSKEMFKISLAISKINIKTAEDLENAINGFYLDKSFKKWLGGGEIANLLSIPQDETKIFLDKLNALNAQNLATLSIPAEPTKAKSFLDTPPSNLPF